MSSQPSNFLLDSDDKFDGPNWVEWKGTIFSAAESRGVDGYLTGAIPQPSNPPVGAAAQPATVYWGSMTPTPEEWKQRNAYAKGMVILNVKNPIGHGVKTDGTAAEAWKSLTDVYDAVSDVGKINADAKLRAIRHTDGADLEVHFCALRTAWSRLNAQGGGMSDADFRIIIIASMPKEWNTFVTTLYSLKTSAEVIVQLKVHDDLLARDRKPSVPAVQALATANSSSSQRSMLVCSNPVCKRTGHTIDRCFKPGGGMEGQYPDWWRKKGNATATPQKPSVNIAMVPHSMSSGAGEHYIFMTTTQREVKDLVTYADSATSDHCFMDLKDFITYQSLAEKDSDTAVKGGKFTIAGTGRVDKHVVFDGRVITLSFKDAMHTPDLSHNLISIGKLDKGGCYSVFGGSGVTFISKDNRPFLQGRGVGTMYEVDVFPMTGPTAQKGNAPATFVPAAQVAHSNVMAFATKSHDRPTDIDTWHRRLGHVGYSIIERMAVTKDLVDGMSVTTLKRGPGMCEDCIMGKQTRRPFDDNEKRRENVLELVHIDLWGPSRTQSNSGNRT